MKLKRLFIIHGKTSTVEKHDLGHNCTFEQDKFYGKATFNLSKASVVDKVAKFTYNAIGSSTYAAVKAGFTDPKTDQATRISFKISLPSKQDGFWYDNRIDKTESILMEAFFDPVCPDSRDSWPPLKRALNHYGSRVSLVVHPFPLPYHDNAFICSRALHIVNKLNTSSTYRLLESFFDQQDKFYNKATFDLSKASVVEKVARFTSNAIGNLNYAAVKAGFTDPKTDQATRISFKYGCVKGVYGAPFFFVNGFPLPGAGSPLDYKAWRNILDPLFSPAGQLKTEALHFFM
ncbi:hypothetical protein RND71_004982 [Anisodus tanguticus]|uniref:Thioredoxin-like fold domain-containing protein n=1 Tax=Anisodus tanguticus TaxID=243964 RepID=A0AAE1VV61_9SOLA|nr:hypothetical protein RND71_004982 [Anisodus tanguticus]